MPLSKEEMDEFVADFGSDEDEEAAVAVKSEEDDKNEGNDNKQTPSLEEADKSEQTSSDGSDLWDGITDEQRSEVTLLQSNLASTQHAEHSQRGRQKALHAKVQKLETENTALKQQQVSVENEDEEDEEIIALRDDLPEVSTLIDKTAEGLDKKIDDLNTRMDAAETVQPGEAEEDEAGANDFDQNAHNTEISKVLNVHSDFNEVVADPNYSTWLNRQSAAVQELAYSPNADGAIAAISLFKGSRKPKDLNSELDTMLDQPGKGAGKSTVINEDDFDAAFEQASNQL